MGASPSSNRWSGWDGRNEKPLGRKRNRSDFNSEVAIAVEVLLEVFVPTFVSGIKELRPFEK